MGLVSSIELAQSGKSVVLFEKSSQLSIITGTNVTEIEHDKAVRKIKFADGQEMGITPHSVIGYLKK